MTEIHIPDDVTQLDDETLVSEVENMAVHEEYDRLTEEQEQYMWDLREELLKRASVGGPHAEYTGPETEASQ